MIIMLTGTVAALETINVFDLFTTITLLSNNSSCFVIRFKINQDLIYLHYIITIYTF